MRYWLAVLLLTSIGGSLSLEQAVSDDASGTANVLTAANRQVRLSLGTQPTVLFVVSAGCDWCERNIPVIQALYSQLAQTHRFVGLAMTRAALARFTEDIHLPFPIYQIEDPHDSVWERYGLGATPSLIVVSAGSRLEKVWNGALRNERKQEVERYFKVPVPDIH